MTQASERWCETCGKPLNTTSATATDCPACEQWWRDNPPPSGTDMTQEREGLCELCGREYRVWSASSPVWNAAVRGGCINGEERFNYLCADCFMGLAEDCGAGSLFYVTAERTCDLQTTTPEGRVWSEPARRWL